jgi:hypothetical protein
VNDTEIPVNQFAAGLRAICDKVIEPDTVINRPTSVVTLEMPFPFTPVDLQFWGGPVIGFQPLILRADSDAKENSIFWIPTRDTAAWLNKLFDLMQQMKRGERVLARLTLHGNFIWARSDQNLYLDGEVFGIRKEGASNPTVLRFPSGDDRRGGNLEMWFYLVQEPLRIVSLNFITATGAMSSAGLVGVPLDPATNIRFGTQENVHVIEITFSRAVSTIPLVPVDAPQSVRLEMLDPGGGAPNRFLGAIETPTQDVIRLRLLQPRVISQPGQYRLTVFGNDSEGARALRAQNNATPLDGDFDGRPGGDFELPFTVIG